MILEIHNLHQAFGGFDLFMGVSGRIDTDSRIGLIGQNGTGKTSLLRILVGKTEPYAGKVVRRNDLRMGYLEQEATHAFSTLDHSLYDEMLTVFEGIHAMEARMRELEDLMSSDYSDAVMEEYGTLQEEFERIGGYDFEVRIKQTLTGLGFKPSQYTMHLAHLSGGQKTRALLARLLLERPDLLVLDEPTNHLDINAIRWLETTLSQWKGALLIVSHDRYFLDVVVNTIWEMTPRGMTSYKGNFTAYENQREFNLAAAEKEYEQEMERLNKELDYIKRNIARASTRNMAVGRLRRLSRDLVAIEELGLSEYKKASKWSETGLGGVRPMGVHEAEQAIKAIVPPKRHMRRFRARITLDRRSGEMVLRGRNLTVGYPDAPLFSADGFTLHRGDVAAMIGANGTGKSTLLKTILEQLEPLQGRIETGYRVKVGYFAQAHERLNPEHTIMEAIMDYQPMRISEAKAHLGPYNFRDDDLFRQVKTLSGGERARLALALLALDGANLLLLDEPTNHLDIQSQRILEDTLNDYDGTILMVSHDRYLIDKLASQIWVVEDGEMTVFEGTYSEYIAALEAEKAGEVSEPKPAKERKPVPSVDLAKLEMQIGIMEDKVAELEALINRASRAGTLHAVQQLSDEYQTARAQLDALLEQWAAAANASA